MSMAMLVQMTLLLMVAQSCVTISKEKSYAQQWKTPMVARNRLETLMAYYQMPAQLSQK